MNNRTKLEGNTLFRGILRHRYITLQYGGHYDGGRGFSFVQTWNMSTLPFASLAPINRTRISPSRFCVRSSFTCRQEGRSLKMGTFEKPQDSVRICMSL